MGEKDARVDLTVEEIREAFASLPPLVEESDSGRGEAAGVTEIVAEMGKVLRKVGLEQVRNGREVVGTVEALAEKMAGLREAIAREQERALARDNQLSALAVVVVKVMDLLEKMADAMARGGDPAELAGQVRLARQAVARDAAKGGLVEVGLPGEEFDPTVHDLAEPPPPGASRYVVSETVTHGYLLNGRPVRKARVRVQAR